MSLLHFQTCKTWILPFEEVQKYVDEGQNLCLLCLIDVSTIAIHILGLGGGGESIEDGLIHV